MCLNPASFFRLNSQNSRSEKKKKTNPPLSIVVRTVVRGGPTRTGPAVTLTHLTPVGTRSPNDVPGTILKHTTQAYHIGQPLTLMDVHGFMDLFVALDALD